MTSRVATVTVASPCDHSYTYTANDDGTTHTKKCGKCGDTLSENHTLTYSASGNVITAACSANCGFSATATISATGKTYDGTAVEATVAKDAGLEGTSFDIAYAVKDGKALAEAPVNAGTYTASITYEGVTASVDFTITSVSITKDMVTVESTVYNGEAQNPDETVTIGGVILERNKDYYVDVDPEDYINAGTYTISIIGEGNYTGNVEMPFTIEKADLTVTANNRTIFYGDEPMNGSVTYDGFVNNENESVLGGSLEYEYTYTNGNDVDNYTITPKGLTSDNYNIEFVTGTLYVLKAEPSYIAPTAKMLTYNGAAQALVSKGKVTGGEIQYCATEDGSYGSDIPTATNAGTYTVYYKVVGDNNHKDVPAQSVEVTIAPKEVSDVTVEGIDTTYTYTGGDIKPAPIVKDGDSVIPDTEYTVTYEGNTVNVGTVTLQITDKEGGNYTVSGSATYKIVKADAKVTAAPTAKDSLVYNGKAHSLINAGTANGGTMQYSINGGETYSTDIPQKTNAGTYTVHYKVVGDNNHNDTEAASVEVNIAKRAITPVDVYSNTYNVNNPLTKVYDGTGNCGGQLIAFENVVDGEDIYYSSYYKYDSPNVGENKYIIAYGIELKESTDYNINNYELTETEVTGKQPYGKITKADAGTIADPTAAEITYGQTLAESELITENSAYGNFKWAETNVLPTVENSGYEAVLELSKDDLNNFNFESVEGFDSALGLIKRIVSLVVNKADLPENAVTAPTAKTDLVYNGEAQALVTKGETTIGTMEYRLDGQSWSADVPTATNAGSYTIFYRVVGNSNYNEFSGEISVTIARKSLISKGVTAELDPAVTPYDGTLQRPDVIVKDNGKALTKDTDYFVEYPEDENLILSGKNSISVVGRENYAGMVSLTYTITSLTPTAEDFTYTAPTTLIYDGTAKEAQFSANLSEPKTGIGEILIISYYKDDKKVETAVDAGNYMLVVFGMGNYAGSVKDGDQNQRLFVISPKQLGWDASGLYASKGEGDSGEATVYGELKLDGVINDEVTFTQPEKLMTQGFTATEPGTYTVDVVSADGDWGFDTSAQNYLYPTANPTVQAEMKAVEVLPVPPELPKEELFKVELSEGISEVPAALAANPELNTPEKIENAMLKAVITANSDVKEENTAVYDVALMLSLDGGETWTISKFEDASATAWYHDGVHYALETGLMVGYDDGLFHPAECSSRAQIVTMLWRLEGSPAATASPFDDVADGAWYEDAIAWAAAKGIVEGYGNGKFGPDDVVTREQMALIMFRYAAYKGYDVTAGENTNLLSFSDAEDISSWAIDAMQWAVGSGLMQGHTNGTIDAKGCAERAQMATVFYRFCEVIEK